MNNQNL